MITADLFDAFTAMPGWAGTEEEAEAAIRLILERFIPDEPTDAMIEAGAAKLPFNAPGCIRPVYLAMVEAASVTSAESSLLRDERLDYERRILAAEVEGVRAEKAMREAAARKATGRAAKRGPKASPRSRPQVPNDHHP